MNADGRFARHERGFTLVELTIYLGAIAALALWTVVSMSAALQSLPAATSGLRSTIDAARALAATTGDGATIVFSGDPAANFTASLYPHRPLANGTSPPTATADAFSSHDVTVTIDGSGPPIALFISSSGTVSVGSWQPGLGNVDPQACTGTLPVVLTAGARTQTWTIDCTSGRLLPPA